MLLGCSWVFLELFVGLSGFLKMFPLYLLDEVQLTWLTHGKTGSLKTHVNSALPGLPILKIWGLIK